jgi:hypothetical protein
MAIFDTTQALRGRIAQAWDDTAGDTVHVGPPIGDVSPSSRAALFLFHTQVNGELRNEPYYAAPPADGPAAQPVREVHALPLDLRYLITVFRPIGAGTPEELNTLGQIVRALHEKPTLSGSSMNGQVVRLSPEPYSMEDLNRIWGLFPQEAYRTSVVYLASPVFVEAPPTQPGPPVQQRRQQTGLGEATAAEM